MAGLLRSAIQERIVRALDRAARSPWLPAVVGTLSFLATVSMTVPATSVLVPGVLLAPRRWRSTALLASVGCALGATLLVAVFHHLGVHALQAQFPGMAESAEWRRLEDWSARFGILSVLIASALPMPQTPALLFCAIADVPDLQVLLAVLGGKLVKYGALGALVAVSPRWFVAFRARIRGPGRR
ncbi:MAG TPA: hypothetical protein VFB20_08375 [Burkholderiales bacterium]|nr:hypothetical protein [Burkholderiales bacterium]